MEMHSLFSRNSPVNWDIPCSFLFTSGYPLSGSVQELEGERGEGSSLLCGIAGDLQRIKGKSDRVRCCPQLLL